MLIHPGNKKARGNQEEAWPAQEGEGLDGCSSHRSCKMAAAVCERVILILLLLALISGMEITRVRLLDDATDWDTDELEVEEGARLTVPCMFFVDEPDFDSQISLEWSMRPSENETFTPIIRLRDTMLLPVPHPNRRAKVPLSLVRDGACALIIDPVTPQDAGLYQLHLAVDGLQYPHTLQVNVQVMERQLPDNLPLTTTTSLKNQENETSAWNLDDVSEEEWKNRSMIRTQAGSSMTEEDIEEEGKWIDKVLKKVSDHIKMPHLLIMGGGILLLTVLGCVTACLCRMKKLRRSLEKIDPVQAVEEGSLGAEPITADPQAERTPAIMAAPELPVPPPPLSPAASCSSSSSTLQQDGIFAERSLKKPSKRRFHYVLRGYPNVAKLGKKAKKSTKSKIS